MTRTKDPRGGSAGALEPAGNADRIPLLDHGYVQLIETWGSDERIVESARMSTSKGFKGWGPVHGKDCTRKPGQVWDQYEECLCTSDPGDESFLKFLWDNKHLSPFEHAGLTVEVQAPIFVFREWHRHRTQSYNEMSGRYTVLPDLYYVPSVKRIMAAKQSTKNKQGSEVGFSVAEAEAFRSDLRGVYAVQRAQYEDFLRRGLAREMARLIVPVAQYSRMRASANLRNWLAFLSLRMEPSAQWEIRQFANAVAELVAARFPRVWQLFARNPA